MKIPESVPWESTGKTLGEGGQGQVEEVRSRASGSDATYALKALGKDKPDKAYVRFEREITAVKALRYHPNIAKVVDFSLCGPNLSVSRHGKGGRRNHP